MWGLTAGMPEVSRFYGIVPHFHAEYGEHEALVNITTLAIIGGGLPPRASSMVTEWASLHQQELGAAWEKAKRLQPPGQIQPLQ